jgi:hypothetical protein
MTSGMNVSRRTKPLSARLHGILTPFSVAGVPGRGR